MTADENARNKPAPPAEKERMELTVARLLNLGLLLSTLVIVSGGVLLVIEQGATPIDFKNLHGQALTLASVPSIVVAAATLDARAVIEIGLLLLVATPIARVALSIFLFLKKADYLYVGITGAVLAILLFAVSGNH